MASRESQGLQISLILFVMVSVVLAVMTFVFYSSSQTAKKDKGAADQKAATATARADLEDFKVQYLMHVLGAAPLAEAELASVQGGVAGDEQITAIEEAYQRDMATYGEGLPPEKMNYRDLPGYLIQALRSKNVDLTRRSDEAARLTKEKEELQKNELQRTQVAQANLEKVRAEMTQEGNKISQEWGRMNKQKTEQFSRHQQEIAKYKKSANTLRKEKADAESQRKQADVTIQKQLKRISELEDEPFEAPDGRVTRVNQQQRVVALNLGFADGLRRQTTFSVYDHEAMNVAPRRDPEAEGGAVRQADNAKGKIEVTKVVDRHLALARIVEDEPGNPILSGDQIFSPAWTPGQRVRFGLVGFMDLDEDRRSDRDLVRNVIAMGGGVIDAEVLDDGNIEGELDERTRYLVRGKRPADRSGLAAWSQMLGDARDLGIEEISLPRLLDLMGYKTEVHTIEMNRRKSGPQLPPTGDDTGAGDFRERRPPEGVGGSAF